MEASLLNDMLDALTAEGGIDAKTVRTEALRLYLNTHPSMSLTVPSPCGGKDGFRWQKLQKLPVSLCQS